MIFKQYNQITLTVLVLVTLTAFAQAQDYGGGLRDVVYGLQNDAVIAAETGNSLAIAAKLRAARAQIFAYTHENTNGVLTRIEWALPLCVCFEWSLQYEFMTHDQAATGIREVMQTLTKIPRDTPENITMAAYAAARMTAAYVDRWMDTHAPACVDLLDAVEDWVLGQSDAARTEWHSRMIYTQGNLLGKEMQFEPPARAWLWESRQARMREYAMDAELHIITRTRIVTHWSKALYFTGHHPGAADKLLTRWWQKYAMQLDDPEFFEQYMRVLLFEAGDWDRAGQLLERANVLSETWTSPTQRALYEQTVNLYYNNIFCAGHELRRLRGMELNAQRKKREKSAK